MRLSVSPVFSALLASAVVAEPIVTRSHSSLPKGFVTTKGSQFQLDGKPFYFVGANSYWLPLLSTQADVESTFKQMRASDIKVLRTWGHEAITADELSGSKESGLTYYQLWNSSDWTLNDGPQGLQRLDNVIETAGKYGLKVILTFTNNWSGYGGLELYINHIVGTTNVTHDLFYTNPKIITSFQRYVKTIVDRYKNSANIFAWELVNEARCLGDLPAGPNCVPGSNTIYNWYKQQSDYIRSLDPYHMITTGGEGHFYWKTAEAASDYNLNGQAGEDFDLDLTLPNIDFGTYHLYPQSWYPSQDYPGSNFTIEAWGKDWILDHASAAKKANKPVILEEFGVTGLANKTEIYPSWIELALSEDQAILPWQFGALGLTENGGNKIFKYADALINGASPNDGYAIYKNQMALYNLFLRTAKIQAAKSRQL
ncbi:Mannan endo-1,4-beta-mannosidase F [Termitomyces sp. T112]|nr:Mannan endo-1,4-beta-mannosidase F [Termitomyces sp. T112]